MREQRVPELTASNVLLQIIYMTNIIIIIGSITLAMARHEPRIIYYACMRRGVVKHLVNKLLCTVARRRVGE